MRFYPNKYSLLFVTDFTQESLVTDYTVIDSSTERLADSLLKSFVLKITYLEGNSIVLNPDKAFRQFLHESYPNVSFLMTSYNSVSGIRELKQYEKGMLVSDLYDSDDMMQAENSISADELETHFLHKHFKMDLPDLLNLKLKIEELKRRW